jgi:hypothetical protein
MLRLIIILILVVGGGGGYYGHSRWGPGGGGQSWPNVLGFPWKNSSFSRASIPLSSDWTNEAE